MLLETLKRIKKEIMGLQEDGYHAEALALFAVVDRMEAKAMNAKLITLINKDTKEEITC